MAAVRCDTCGNGGASLLSSTTDEFAECGRCTWERLTIQEQDRESWEG